MSVFVDTGVFYAHQNAGSTRHEVAVAAFDALATGAHGQLYTSDYVHDEAVTLTLKRTADHEQARRVGQRIRGEGAYPDAFELLYTGQSAFQSAVDVFESYPDQSLSFTDAATIALVREQTVDYVCSFDDDFDGLVDRIDPRAVAEQR